MTVVELRNELDWMTIPIPLSQPPVEMVRLHVDSAMQSSSSIVRFPAGWNRSIECRYSIDEEIVMLDGELLISGLVIASGSYAFIPTGVLRFESSTPERSLALAWFSGPTGSTDDAVDLPIVVVDLASIDLDDPSPLGLPGRLLRSSPNGTCWVVGLIPEDVDAPADAAVEVCEVATGAWSRAEPGQPIAAALGRCVVRCSPTPPA